jgi:hypothetical protein
LLKAFRKQAEPPIETVDAETLRQRIGEPLPAKKPAPPEAGYVRPDGRPTEERSWRKVAGLNR